MMSEKTPRMLCHSALPELSSNKRALEIVQENNKSIIDTLRSAGAWCDVGVPALAAEGREGSEGSEGSKGSGPNTGERCAG